MLRKLAVALAGLVAIATGLGIASHFWFLSKERAAEESLRSALAKTSFSPQELREDVAALRAWLQDVHPPETRSIPLGGYETGLQALVESLDGPLDHLAFYRRVAPVVNRLNDEHTMVFAPDGRDDVPVFPFDVRIHDNRIFVWTDWHGRTSVVRGDELLSINGIDAASIIASLSRFFSGTTARQKQTYLEWEFASALLQALDLQPPFEVRRRSVDTGNVSFLQVPAVERPRQPRPAFSFVSFETSETNSLLLNFNAFEDKEDRFDGFLEEMFRYVHERGIESVIIDLRRNQGGTSELGDRLLMYLTDRPFTQLRRVEVTVSEAVREEFLAYVPGFVRWLPVQYLHPWLRPLWTRDFGDTASIDFEPLVPADNPLRFDGDVYVLIGPGTMSSASLFAAAIRHYGLGILVGEKTGGFATMYGNVVDARLPNTGLRVWMPTSVVYGHGEGPVVPDHEVPASVQDIVASRDAVLEFTLNLTAGRRNEY